MKKKIMKKLTRKGGNKEVSLTELIVRIACTFLILLLLTRIMGRKELRQLTYFNFVSGIAIGSIGADFILSEDVNIRNGIIAMIGWAVFTLTMGWIDIKSKNVRKVIEGDPVLLIKNGQILRQALQRVRLDVDALKALLR